MNNLSIEELKIILVALIVYRSNHNSKNLSDKIFDLQEKIIDEWESRENDNKRI